VTPDIADSLGLATPSGALVAKVATKGPAAKAGLVAGDVVVGVDDKEVKDPQAFEYRFLTKGIGGSAELTLLRKGQKLKAIIALLAPVEDPPRDARDLTGRHPLSGCKVANLSPAVAQELGIDDDTRQGVVVVDVKDQTPAARLGVKRGDIVVGLNNEKVSSVAQLAAALDLSGDRWRLSVERDGKLFNLAISG
jgi:S1-C subfamily serine protease